MKADIGMAGDDPQGSVLPAGAHVPVRATRHAYYVLILLTFAYTLAAIDRSIVAVVSEPLRKEFGLADSEIGFLIGFAFGIPYAIAGMPFGLLIDRVSRRKFLAAMMVIWSVMTSVCGFAQNAIQLMLARMAVGTAESGFPAAHSLITDLFPASRRPMALGIMLSGGTLAYLLTFAIVGMIIAHWGWRMAFFVVGLPGVAMALLVFLTVRDPVRGGVEERPQAAVEPAPSLGQSLRFVFSTRSFRHLFIGYAFAGMTVSTFWAWTMSFLIRVHGLDVAHASMLLALGAGVTAVIGQVISALVNARLGAKGMKPVLQFVIGTTLLVSPFGLLMCFSPSLPVVVVSMSVVGMGVSCFWGPLQGLMLTLAKVRMRGVTASLLNVTGTLVGLGAGPLVAGIVSQIMGGGTAVRYGLATIFVLNLFAALFFWTARTSIAADLDSVSGVKA